MASSRKSPTLLPQVQKHQQLYKGTTPPWKDAYRKRCFERLKKNRDKFLTRFRKIGIEEDDDDSKSMVPHLMAEEWKLLQEQDKGLPSLRSNMDDLMFENCEEETIDDMLSVFEEIRAELLEEERHILEEYENGLVCDEHILSATIETLQAEDMVVCPICSKDLLMLNKGIFFCKCGARIDTERDCLSMKDVYRSLKAATQEHGEICSAIPKFAVINQVGVDNLIMTCQTCDFMYIVV